MGQAFRSFLPLYSLKDAKMLWQRISASVLFCVALEVCILKVQVPTHVGVTFIQNLTQQLWGSHILIIKALQLSGYCGYPDSFQSFSEAVLGHSLESALQEKGSR